MCLRKLNFSCVNSTSSSFPGEESDTATDSPFLLEPPIETSTQQQTQHGTETAMLPIFQSLSRLEAIEQVLAGHIGTIVHIDFIVKTLYGELEPDVLKVVKGRVQSSLTKGRESNKWFSVSGKPGHYTLSLTKYQNRRRKIHLPEQRAEIINKLVSNNSCSFEN